jgi:hypothetical protein
MLLKDLEVADEAVVDAVVADVAEADAVLVVHVVLLDVLLLAVEVDTVVVAVSAGVEDHAQLFTIRDLTIMEDGAITTMDYPTLHLICLLGYGDLDVVLDVDI